MTYLPLGAYDWRTLGPPGRDASRAVIANYEAWLESEKPPVATLDWRIANELCRNEEARAQKAAAAAAQERAHEAARRQAEQNERAKRAPELYQAVWTLWLKGEAGSPQCQKLFRAYAVARGYLAPDANFGSDTTYQRVNRDLNSGDSLYRYGGAKAEEIFSFKYASVRSAAKS